MQRPHLSCPQHVALLALALAATGPSCTSEPALPDVVLISLDSVRADALTFRDAERAPNLAALARRGFIFEQAVAGSSWTLPTHAQMFTGAPPAVHGVRTDDVRIDPRMPTLPELLDAAGYRTAGFWTGWYLAGDYGFERGFDEYRNAMTDGERYDTSLRQARASANPTAIQRAKFERDVANHQDVTSRRACDLAGDAIAATAADEPLFLFLHLFDPHYDYVPPEPFDQRFDPDYAGAIDGRDFWRNPAIYDKEAAPPRRIGERDLEHVRALYAGEIAWCDQEVGRVLAELERRGRLDQTLILVTSDHGEEFFDHGGRGHRHTLYDELLRVPLLIVPPRSALTDAQRSSQQVELSDLLPTICDYVGLAAPSSACGRSLRPLVEGRAAPERPAVATLTRRLRRSDGRREAWITQALRTPREKLIRTLLIGPRGRPTLKDLAWFDLDEDPLEQRSVRDPNDPRVRAAWERLEASGGELRRQVAGLDRSPLDQRTTGIKDAFADDLGALGYLEDAEDDDELPPSWLFEPLPPIRLP